MRGEVVEAEVRFTLDDRSTRFAVQQYTADQVPRKLDGRPFEELQIDRFRFAKQSAQRPGIMPIFDSILGLGFVTSPQCTLEH